jgi:hypothetical protein
MAGASHFSPRRRLFSSLHSFIFFSFRPIHRIVVVVVVVDWVLRVLELGLLPCACVFLVSLSLW